MIYAEWGTHLREIPIRVGYPSAFTRSGVPIPGADILLEGGNIHCSTQQQPAGPGALHTPGHGLKVAVMHKADSRLEIYNSCVLGSFAGAYGCGAHPQ